MATETTTLKAIVIGRHTPDLGNTNVEVIEVRPITFPVTGIECRIILNGLMDEARKAGAAILLQNTPGQVAAALARMALSFLDPSDDDERQRLGVVITTPGPRPIDGGPMPFVFDHIEWIF